MNISFEYVVRLGDNALILGQRLTEWLGHSPAIEEDIASANVALDLIGQARLWLAHAGKLEGKDRDEDDLAYNRNPSEFRNCTMLELPNGDFAMTIVRRQLFDAYHRIVLERLVCSGDAEVAAIAAKSKKEADYHHRHSAGWVIRLGDGTSESHRRAESALHVLWPHAQELFVDDVVDPNASSLRPAWLAEVSSVFSEATLALPLAQSAPLRGRPALHTEHLGPLLAEMQSLRRAHPGARW